eukprot:7093422-Pyramimonas_sp.AAC.1
MTELTECKRVEDPCDWFLAVQDEFRRGALSERTRIFFFAWQTDGCAGVVGERRTAVRKRALSRGHRGNCEAERARM